MIKISMLAQWFNHFVISIMQNVLLGLDALLDDLAASVFFISPIQVRSLLANNDQNIVHYWFISPFI